VGGTKIQISLFSPNGYLSENWWDDSFDNGKLGTAGYGYSWHFPEPNYQTPHVSLPGRSIPDVSAEAGDGIVICQGFKGASPNCFYNAGTSLAAPLWAGIWARVSQENTLANGFKAAPAGEGYLYTLPPSSFQPASSMIGPGNDFAHLGLGSPNITNLVANVAGRAQITGINPASGPLEGGTTATITGHGFVGVSKVNFSTLLGSWPVASFQVLSESQIRLVTSPCSNPGYCRAVDINVATPAGPSQPSKVQFAFLPTITSVTPNSGSMDGGTTVTITGSGFDYTGGQTFYFGSWPAVNVYCPSSTQCTMATPAEPPGTVPVVAAGTSPGEATFTFIGPAITEIKPNVGPQTGGTYVNIYGVSLSNDMVVKFGNMQVGAPLCVGNYWCTVYSPPGTGSVHITATRNGITTFATQADLFTYEPFPYGTLSPDQGPDTGGTVVTITGGNFSTAPGGTQFVFSFTAGGPDQLPTNVSCSSASVCRLTTPPCASQNFCSIEPYAIVKATDGGLTNAIGRFNYNLTSPPPQPPPPKGPPPCDPSKHTCQ
jgi:hypothetical protein